MFTMNRSRLARNPAVDTTTSVAAGRVVAVCVVVATSASRLHSLTDRARCRTTAGYSELYLAGHSRGTTARVGSVTAASLGSGYDRLLRRGAARADPGPPVGS